MHKRRKKLTLARETIRDLSLGQAAGGTRGTIACTLLSQLPVGCSDYCPTTPITTLGHTCAD